MHSCHFSPRCCSLKLNIYLIGLTAWLKHAKVVRNQGNDPILISRSCDVIYDVTGMSRMSNDVTEIPAMFDYVKEMPGMSSGVREELRITVMTIQ